MTRRGWIASTIAAVVCVALLVTWMVLRNPAMTAPVTTGPTLTGTGSPSTGRATAGTPGLGDTYFPDAGNGGYEVDHYDIDVRWDPATSSFTGTTTITARATSDLSSFYVDYYGTITGVQVNGAAARHARADRTNVLIDTAVAAGRFTVTVEHTSAVFNDCGREAMVQAVGVIVAGEPESAACWFPANDHPSDPATFDIIVRTPTSMQGASVGHLVEQQPGMAHYRVTNPTPTYTVLVAASEFDTTTVDVNGKTSTIMVPTSFSAADRARLVRELKASPQIVRDLERFFGPYPADAAGGIVASKAMRFAALETSGSPLYSEQGVWQGIIVHELAHMWFGNAVTLRRWQDIWLNEAMASYATWVHDEDGDDSTADTFAEQVTSFDDMPDYWAVNLRDPGVNDMFGLVYYRGPMAMHALRVVMGEQKFFALWKDWAQLRGPHTLDEFIAMAEERHGAPLQKFFSAWVDGTDSMPRTPEYGFR